MILVINEDTGLCDSITEMFRICGMPCYGTNTEEAMSEPEQLYSILLLPSPYAPREIVSTVKKLREKFKGLPICKVGIPNTEEPCIFDTIIYPSTKFDGVCLSLDNLVLQSFNIGKYQKGVLKAYIDEGDVFYNTAKLGLTKTESIILRCLILSSPYGCQKEELLKYCFRRGSYTEASAIRTHICSINKKFNDISGQRLILSEKKKYYINEAVCNKTTG